MPDHRDPSTLLRKLQLLDAYLDELAPLVLDGRAPAGNVRRRAAERLVQLVVEVTIDVNGLMLAVRRHHPPASARDSFVAVRDAGLLPRNLADRFLASYVGLRNRVVHDYDDLDPGILARSAARLIPDARAFVRAVLASLPAPPKVREKRAPYRGRAARPESKRTGATSKSSGRGATPKSTGRAATPKSSGRAAACRFSLTSCPLVPQGCETDAERR